MLLTTRTLKLTAPLKIGLSKKKLVFQLSIFRDKLLVSGKLLLKHEPSDKCPKTSTKFQIRTCSLKIQDWIFQNHQGNPKKKKRVPLEGQKKTPPHHHLGKVFNTTTQSSHFDGKSPKPWRLGVLVDLPSSRVPGSGPGFRHEKKNSYP